MSDSSDDAGKNDDGAQILAFKTPKRMNNSVLGDAFNNLYHSGIVERDLTFASGLFVQVKLEGAIWVSLNRIAEIEEFSLVQLVEKTNAAKPQGMELSEALGLVAISYTSSFLETSLEVIQDFLSIR